eukprot:TRINITY_DN25872_c0_g1_i2.p1 TRINITY_DN25872_c0_g1~~TRINITY_DN25872_c0_g1_i2.p1  ORF type:complete len:483 (-),score=71.60 TRINITY_DN25872_c0_g1_i2:664-2112(-)
MGTLTGLFWAVAALMYDVEEVGALEIELLRPSSSKVTERGAASAGDLQVPLPFLTSTEEFEAEASTSNGVLARLSASAADLEASSAGGGPGSLYVQLFTTSYCSSREKVEKSWFAEEGVPPPEEHLRFTAFFDTFFQNNGGMLRGEHGDTCVQYFLHAELCLQALSCVPLTKPTSGGGGLQQDLWLPTPAATSYRVEAYVSPSSCSDMYTAPPAASAFAAVGNDALPVQKRVRRMDDFPSFQPDVLLKGSRKSVASVHQEYRVLFVDEPSAWFANHRWPEPLSPASSWMDMMGSVLHTARPWAEHNALWLEFGVASGRSLAFIAQNLRSLAPQATLHGFDSFQGIPQGWHKYSASTFSHAGEAPEFLKDFPNIRLHIGFFGKTLPKMLNEDQNFRRPIALLHGDMDLFASAREVLSLLRCQLMEGTLIVFDELFNYKGWQTDGEYRAWSALAAAHNIRWRPLGVFFEQAVAIVVESTPTDCF